MPMRLWSRWVSLSGRKMILQRKRSPVGPCMIVQQNNMRVTFLLGVALLVSCAPSRPYPLPGRWADLPEARTRDGALVALGLALPEGEDSTYRQALYCLSHDPCTRWWIDMFVYSTLDTTLMTRIEAGPDSQGVAIQLDITFNHRVTFESVLGLYRSALGQPSELGTDHKAYYPYAEWRRDDLILRLFGSSPTRGKPVTAYLNRRGPSYGVPGRPDIAWQLRACEELGYMFCTDIRR